MGLGMLMSSKISVIRTDESEIATMTVSKPTIVTYILTISAMFLPVWYLYEVLDNTISYSLGAISLAAIFFCGTKIRDSISNWTLLISHTLWRIQIICLWLLEQALGAVSLLFQLIESGLDILSRPPRLFFQK